MEEIKVKNNTLGLKVYAIGEPQTSGEEYDLLVSTFLDSLEKLKNTHFSIGLISHVAELKHRINAKILVQGATEERGSVVSLSI